jgi:salicylate hydroxylase
LLPFFLFITRHNIFVDSNSKKEISIIGAGISGLTLGVILKSYNIPCIIYEKYGSVSEYGAGISISPNGAEVLKSLNIYDDLLKISAKPHGANFYSNLKKIITIPTEVLTTSRKSLYKVLYEKYLSLKGKILFDHELINIDFDKKILYFSNKKNYEFEHIAACDGIKSFCQDLSRNSIKSPVYSGYSVWRSILPTNQKNINFILGSNFHIVTYPIDSNRSSFVAVIKTKRENNESWKQKGDYEDLRADLPRFVLDQFKSLEQNNEIYKWGVFTRPVLKELFCKNITFLGDAAHPIVPFMGQGACLAMEDAYVFGNLIRKNNNFKKTQKEYQNIRFSRVKLIHNKSLNQARLNHLKNPIFVFVRNALMKYTRIISSRTKAIWSYNVTKKL